MTLEATEMADVPKSIATVHADRRNPDPAERREQALSRLTDEVLHAVRREQHLLGLSDDERRSLVHLLVERVLARVDATRVAS